VIAVISNAVESLLSVYGKNKEISEVKGKREIVAERLKIFTKAVYEKKLNEVEKLKSGENLSEEEKSFRLKKFEDFEIFKIQFETYTAMDKDIMNYDKLLKGMQRKIKKTRYAYKNMRDMSSKFENLKIEWS
jgi:hypothetical protein